jgi:hypothetical protein
MHSTMNARSMASVRGSSGDVLALASKSQVLLAVFDRAAPLQMRFEPVRVSGRNGFAGDLEVSCIDLARVGALAATGATGSLLAALTSAQLPPDAAQLGGAGRSVHQLALVTVPARFAAGDVLGLEARTFALDFVPLLIQWLQPTAEEPMLAASESAAGRLRVFAARLAPPLAAAPAGGLAPRELVELDATRASMALGGLPLEFPSPVLALAEWTCARTGWRARVAGCEDGTLELVATAPGAERPRLLRHRIRVERPINVACLFGGAGALSAVAPPPLAGDAAAAPGDAPTLHLLVGSALCGACVYADVLRSGLGAPVRALPNAESVLCAAPWRAHPNALLIGTWSRTLHCLRLERSSGARPDAGWRCAPVWSRELPHALYGIELLDLTHDGLDEVVVRTLQGVHVLQEDLPRVCAELEVGLRALLSGPPDARARAVDGGEEDGDLGVLMGALARGRAIEALQERLRALRAEAGAGGSLDDGEVEAA